MRQHLRKFRDARGTLGTLAKSWSFGKQSSFLIVCLTAVKKDTFLHWHSVALENRVSMFYLYQMDVLTCDYDHWNICDSAVKQYLLYLTIHCSLPYFFCSSLHFSSNLSPPFIKHNQQFSFFCRRTIMWEPSTWSLQLKKYWLKNLLVSRASGADCTHQMSVTYTEVEPVLLLFSISAVACISLLRTGNFGTKNLNSSVLLLNLHLLFDRLKYATEELAAVHAKKFFLHF